MYIFSLIFFVFFLFQNDDEPLLHRAWNRLSPSTRWMHPHKSWMWCFQVGSNPKSPLYADKPAADRGARKSTSKSNRGAKLISKTKPKAQPLTMPRARAAAFAGLYCANIHISCVLFLFFRRFYACFVRSSILICVMYCDHNQAQSNRMLVYTTYLIVFNSLYLWLRMPPVSDVQGYEKFLFRAKCYDFTVLSSSQNGSPLSRVFLYYVFPPRNMPKTPIQKKFRKNRHCLVGAKFRWSHPYPLGNLRAGSSLFAI